jgi:hypothetical protein
MAAKKVARRSARNAPKTRKKVAKRPAGRRLTARPKAKRATSTRRTAAKVAVRRGARRGTRPVKASAAKPKSKVKQVARRPARQAKTVRAARKTAAPAAKRPAPAAKPPKARAASPAPSSTRQRQPRPALDRARRILPEAAGIEREVADESVFAAARSGGEELQHKLGQHTESSPALTAGDVDARWDDAYAVGDEAPGGDNPTPDQDRVDDIGKALGVTYEDSEELQGSDKITERDRHRWELDPASSDDWPHDKQKD